MKRHLKQKTKPDNKKAHILESALKIFARYGYEGTTVRDICEKAGLSVSVIHYHWDSKEHLWQEVCKLCSQRLFKILEETSDLTQPPQTAMPEFLGKMFDAVVMQPEILRIALWQTLEAEAFDFEATETFFKPLNEFGLEYLKKHQGTGNMKQVDLQAAIESIRNMFVMMVVDQRGHRNYYGKDLSDPQHKARLRTHFVRTSLYMLRLEE